MDLLKEFSMFLKKKEEIEKQSEKNEDLGNNLGRNDFDDGKKTEIKKNKKKITIAIRL